MSAAEESTSPFRPKKPRRWSISDVLDAWKSFGPLVHYPTGFPALDFATGGGPVFGTRWYVMGAPDACKTLFLSMIAHVWDSQGLTVGMLAVDEEPEDLAARFIQRIRPPSWNGAHFQRIHCEQRHEAILEEMRRETDHIGVSFYGPEWTIEGASADLSELARSRGQNAAMMFDSAQTIGCDSIRKEKKEISLRERITENVHAIRHVGSSKKMITLTTSEMNRSAYRAIGKVEQNDMAAAKESGAIEYSARVMLAMRVVPEEIDCIEVKVIKNKHGPSVPAIEPFYLALDRPSQTLLPREAPIVDVEPSLVDRLVLELSRHPRGLTGEALAKIVHKSKSPVIAACQSAEAGGLIRRLDGTRSPWVVCDNVDADAAEFP